MTHITIAIHSVLFFAQEGLSSEKATVINAEQIDEFPTYAQTVETHLDKIEPLPFMEWTGDKDWYLQELGGYSRFLRPRRDLSNRLGATAQMLVTFKQINVEV